MNKKRKVKSLADRDPDKQQTEHITLKCFICGSEDHLIAKCKKTPKENEKQQKQVRFS